MHTAAAPATSFVPFAALQAEIKREQSPLRAAITGAYRRDETEAVEWLLAQGASANADAAPLAHRLVVRSARKAHPLVRRRRADARVLAVVGRRRGADVPGRSAAAHSRQQTADRLIADKISKGDWRKHLGESPSLFVNAATWGLLITGKLVSHQQRKQASARR